MNGNEGQGQIRVAYVPLRYPTLSQTFIQREVQGLNQHGLALTVYPCLPQWDGSVVLPRDHPPIVRPVRTVGATDLLGMAARSVLRPALGGFVLARLFRLGGMHKDHALQTLAGLIAGFRLGARLKKHPVDLIHASWATAPATAAWTASRITGIPFSFGAHAYDVYRHGGDPFLKAKLREARMVHTTTRQNVEYLGGLKGPEGAPLVLARRGLPSLPGEPPPRRVWNGTDAICILSVARLVGKKGIPFQLAACAKLREMGVPFELRIAGDGPLHGDLIEERNRLGLGDCVKFLGAVDAAEVARHYAWADVFLHTGVVDEEGDRDGLPNVIPEAMAHGVPVISSREPGANEAVEDMVTGRVVEVGDAGELAGAIVQLRRNWELAAGLAANGRRWVEDNFLTETNTGILAEAMRKAAG